MNRTTIETKLLCPQCKNITIIFRVASRQRKKGHYKKMYCYKCKQTLNHIELKNGYDFTDEEIEQIIDKMKKESKELLDE